MCLFILCHTTQLASWLLGARKIHKVKVLNGIFVIRRVSDGVVLWYEMCIVREIIYRTKILHRCAFHRYMQYVSVLRAE